MPPILLNARELAKRLDVSSQTVLAWARRDEVPCIRDGRNHVLFNLDAVLKVLRSNAAVRSGESAEAEVAKDITEDSE